MATDEQIEAIVTQSINIIEEEINTITAKQASHGLDKNDTDKVIDFLKTLVLVQRDRRQVAKEDDLDINDLSKEELETEFLKEAEKLKKANVK